jgi:hypothetical protein
LELTEIVDYSNIKVKSSKKQFEYSRHSREESAQAYQQPFEVNAIDEEQLKDEMRMEMRALQKEHEIGILDRVKRMMN